MFVQGAGCYMLHLDAHVSGVVVMCVTLGVNLSTVAKRRAVVTVQGPLVIRFILVYMLRGS